ncbi:OmpA family protein [Butyrivibrio sp. AE3004]|uniref:OmpA family protein n=1 Tax=Butyrivibrio sp. AE3004 TaxID=1506994 RepID=UPI0004949F11|nr:OmpA family protein [Butyrivibrio sp. AE3004]
MSRKRHETIDEETTYWLSYSDMMAALLLTFVLIISFTMLQAKRLYEEKESELEQQHELLAEQQEKLDEQQIKLDEQKKIMEKQQEQLDKIIGVRSNLVEALKEEFDGSDLKVSIDPNTGAITLDSSILFDVNKWDIKESGQAFLENFLPRYIGVLLKPEFKSYVSEIIIEGHTDTNGSYMHNLELSQDRALSVARFCLMDESTVLNAREIEELRPILTANGRSFSDPVYGADGNVDLAASRRVEFKFRLTDEEMVTEMMELLSSN